MNQNKNSVQEMTSNHVYHDNVAIKDGAYGYYKEDKEGRKFLPCGAVP